MTSDSILARLENLEVDIGISYVDTEPPPRFETMRMYDEHYVLLVAPESPLAERDQVTWAEAGELPLCLLTPDMQNRRLIDRHLAEAGVEAKPDPREQLHARSLCARALRQMVEHPAVAARRDAGPAEPSAVDSAGQAHGDPQDRA